MDQLLVLIDQESTYKTCDYLTMFQRHRRQLEENQSVSNINGTKKRKLLSSFSTIDGLGGGHHINKAEMNENWRLKMVEWVYRGKLVEQMEEKHQQTE